MIDWLGDEMRLQMGQALGVIEAPAPTVAGLMAPGFGGGVPLASPPAAASFADTIRRRAFGG